MMTLRVSGAQGPKYVVPPTLSTHAFRARPSAPVRTVPLVMMRMNWFIDGRTFDVNDMTEVAAVETVAPGSTHIWELVNQPNPMGMAAAHPIHVHGPQFRVLSRKGGGANALRDGIHDAGLDRHGGGAARGNGARADHVLHAPRALPVPLPHPRARGHGHDAQLPDSRVALSPDAAASAGAPPPDRPATSPGCRLWRCAARARPTAGPALRARRPAAAALSSPATRNNTDRAALMMGGVRVRRQPRDVSTCSATTQRVISRPDGMPGKSDAVWPSAPRPSSTRSSTPGPPGAPACRRRAWLSAPLRR